MFQCFKGALIICFSAFFLVSCGNPEEASNALAVEAKQLSDQAKATSDQEEKIEYLEEALANLNTIIEDYESTQNAVQLVQGRPVAGVSRAEIESRLNAAKARLAQKRATEQCLESGETECFFNMLLERANALDYGRDDTAKIERAILRHQVATLAKSGEIDRALETIVNEGSRWARSATFYKEVLGQYFRANADDLSVIDLIETADRNAINEDWRQASYVLLLQEVPAAHSASSIQQLVASTEWKRFDTNFHTAERERSNNELLNAYYAALIASGKVDEAIQAMDQVIQSNTAFKRVLRDLAVEGFGNVDAKRIALTEAYRIGDEKAVDALISALEADAAIVAQRFDASEIMRDSVSFAIIAAAIEGGAIDEALEELEQRGEGLDEITLAIANRRITSNQANAARYIYTQRFTSLFDAIRTVKTDPSFTDFSRLATLHDKIVGAYISHMKQVDNLSGAAIQAIAGTLRDWVRESEIYLQKGGNNFLLVSDGSKQLDPSSTEFNGCDIADSTIRHLDDLAQAYNVKADRELSEFRQRLLGDSAEDCAAAGDIERTRARINEYVRVESRDPDASRDEIMYHLIDGLVRNGKSGDAIEVAEESGRPHVLAYANVRSGNFKALEDFIGSGEALKEHGGLLVAGAIKGGFFNEAMALLERAERSASPRLVEEIAKAGDWAAAITFWDHIPPYSGDRILRGTKRDALWTLAQEFADSKFEEIDLY